MTARGRFKQYRTALEELGLRLLDVYRFKDHEELRVTDSSSRVLLLKLPRMREEMKIDEFKSIVSKILRELAGEAKES